MKWEIEAKDKREKKYEAGSFNYARLLVASAASLA